MAEYRPDMEKRAEYRPDMEKRAEWPARGRAAVSPFPGDILPSRRVHVSGPQGNICDKCLTGPAWLLFSKTGPLFSPSL